MHDRARTIAALVLALIVALSAVAGWEAYWRASGYEPALYDDRDFWSQERARAVAVDQERNLTIAGASRIQLAFSARTFERLRPDWTVNFLALNANYPTAVLEDLAADERFAGVLLVAVDARGLSHWYREMSAPWVRHYRRDFGPQRRIERRLLTALQQRLTIVGPSFNLVRRLIGWIEDRPPPRHYTRLLEDRTIEADFSVADVSGLRRHFVDALAAAYEAHPAPSPRQWVADLEPIRRAVETIEQRGGEVVFLRMPTADGHWALDQANYPREAYWDRLGEVTGAQTLHFADFPALANLTLPDTSHIDRTDRDRFTRDLVSILTEAGILPGG